MDLSPELIAAIKQAIANGDFHLASTNGRSPMRPRQLHDLRLLPTKDDPRPTFFWSAEAPRDGVDLSATTEFPKLMWHGETGEEITVQSKEAQSEMLDEGYVLIAPAIASLDPHAQHDAEMAEMRAALEALTPEERELLLEGQRKQRLDALQAKLSKLTDNSLESLMADAKAKATKREKKTA